MLRYNTKQFWSMKPEEDGDWVLHSDVEDQIVDLNGEIDALNADVTHYKQRASLYFKESYHYYSQMLYYRQKLELLGNIAAALTVLGVIGCSVYSFGW